jgi:hypothetical protein
VLFIRDEQLAVFRAERVTKFEARMLEHVAQTHPEDYSSLGGAEGVRSFLRRAIDAAASRGIRTERGVSLFIELVLAYGLEFELAPYREWALRMLANSRLPGQMRLTLIQNRLSNLTQGRRMVRFEPPS